MESNKEHLHEFRENGRFKVEISMKQTALNDPFREIPPADEMIVFLRQNIGMEAKPLVKKGELVRHGQKIGDHEDWGSMVVPVHSPVNGEILDIKKMIHPISKQQENAIIIRTKEGNGRTFLDPIAEMDAPKEILLERVREAGILGLGGASFPTHVKYSTKNKISHLIINAKESDPNIACDYRLMIEKPKEVVSGIQLIARILEAKEIIFATRTQENETPEFEALLRDNEIKITRIRPNYSVGSERLLVKEVLGKELTFGKFPPDTGVIVNNIATTYAVSRAIKNGEPLVSRGLTLYSKKTGGMNLWVRYGTPIEHILTQAGVSASDISRISLGSIMMGPTIKNVSTPILKATSGITVFTRDEPDPYSKPLPCIRCGYCNLVCPVFIYPQLIMDAEKKGKINLLRKYHVEVCIECGLCSYVCPSQIKLTEYLTGGKKRIREKQS